MAAPTEPREPVPCEECGAAMDEVPQPGTSDESESETRFICPRCNHEAPAR